MEDECIAKIWKYGITGFVALMVSIMASCQVTNYRIASAIGDGVNPLEAKCAIRGDGDTKGNPCVILYAK